MNYLNATLLCLESEQLNDLCEYLLWLKIHVLTSELAHVDTVDIENIIKKARKHFNMLIASLKHVYFRIRAELTALGSRNCVLHVLIRKQIDHLPNFSDCFDRHTRFSLQLFFCLCTFKHFYLFQDFLIVDLTYFIRHIPKKNH